MFKRSKQPAIKSYFFGKGYRDLANTIADAWRLNLEKAQDYFAEGGYSFEFGLGAFKSIYYWAAGICVVVFGTSLFLVLSVIHITILFLFFLLVYLMFSLVWAIDAFYRFKEKIFAACPNQGCYQKHKLPIYHCPNCNVGHDRLWPNSYGIFKRTCECGHKIPTSFINGRNKLYATCPSCKNPIPTKEGRPIIIPIVGARNAGKTTYMHSLVNQIELYAKKKNYKFSIEKSSEVIHKNEISKLNRGEKLQPTQKGTLVAFNFNLIKGKRKYSFYIYDAAGETYQKSTDVERHMFYNYFNALIFIIDPFSFTIMRENYAEMIRKSNQINANEIVDIDDTYDILVTSLEKSFGVGVKDKVAKETAFVISKADLVEDELKLGSEPINTNVKEFINSNSETDLIGNIASKFSKVRYFSVISRGKDSERVESPFMWIFKRELMKRRMRRLVFNSILLLFLGACGFGVYSARNHIAEAANYVVDGFKSINFSMPKSKKTPQVQPVKVKQYISIATLNVRERANSSARVLGKFYKNDVVSVYQFIGNWAKVDYKGKKAFVFAKYIKPHDSSSQVNKKQVVGKKTGNLKNRVTTKTDAPPVKKKILDKPKLDVSLMNNNQTVWIDGKKQVSNEILKLSEGRHVITTWQQGHKTQNKTIRLKAGEVRKWNSPSLPVLNSFNEQVNGLEIKMKAVEGGIFTMGDGKRTNRPRHLVAIDGFYVSEQYITYKWFLEFLNDAKVSYFDVISTSGNKQYIRVDGSTAPIKYAYGKYSLKNESLADKPVQNVSWYGANAFCKWLGEKSGKKYRLITEAEWEFAAGGNDIAQRYIKGDGFKLQREWCLDTYLSNFYQESQYNKLVLNPCNIKNKKDKVIRGRRGSDFRSRSNSLSNNRAATFRVVWN